MHEHNGQQDGRGGMGGMGHGGGLKGALLMALCCLPMIAIAVLLLVGVLR